jgi:hypothetical protein
MEQHKRRSAGIACCTSVPSETRVLTASSPKQATRNSRIEHRAQISHR